MPYATVQVARPSPWGPMLLGYHARADGSMGSWLSDAVDSVEKSYKTTSGKVSRYLAKNPQVGQIAAIGAAAIPGVGLVAAPAVAALSTYASFEGAKRLQREADADYLASIMRDGATPSSAGPLLTRVPIGPPAPTPPPALVVPPRPSPSAFANIESTAATAAIAIVLVAILAARRH